MSVGPNVKSQVKHLKPYNLIDLGQGIMECAFWQIQILLPYIKGHHLFYYRTNLSLPKRKQNKKLQITILYSSFS